MTDFARSAWSRRQVLRSALALPGAAGLSLAASAQAFGERRFVLVLLRGGLDGLTLLPAPGDPGFAAARGALAAPGSGGGAALPLDGFFALHPQLPQLHAMYRRGELLPVHAVATPYRDRSHFDAQNLLETGAATPFALNTGWLNRAVALLAPAAADTALALAPALPLVLQGPARVSNHAPAHPRRADAELLDRLARIYAPDAAWQAALERARATLALVQRAGSAPGAASAHPVLQAAQAAAQLLRTEGGPRVAVIEADGWDSHATQSSPVGLPARELRALDQALEALRTGLDAAWGDTLVLVATEFGRTVAPNGAGGTDHGTGGALLLAGGAVAGGRVLADWPGLRPAQLHEGRDLRPTADLFAVLAAALGAHWRADPAALARVIAPGRVLPTVPWQHGLIRG